MSKTKLIFSTGTVVLMIILAVSPGVISTSTEIIEKDKIETIPEAIPIHHAIYVGDIYIEGTGDHSTSIVMATAEQNLRIKIDRGGSDVVIKAKYLFQCTGLFDHGYGTFQVMGGDKKEVDTGEYEEGYFYITIHNCKWGDIIGWVLRVKYDDNIYLPWPDPLEDFDSGSGICSLSRSGGTSAHTFLQFLERFTDQFPHTFPLLKQLSCRLLGNIIAIKGTIICE